MQTLLSSDLMTSTLASSRSDGIVALLLQDEPGGGGTLLKFVTDGGPIGYIIVLLSVVALAFVVIHFTQIRRSVLLPAGKIRAMQEMV